MQESTRKWLTRLALLAIVVLAGWLRLHRLGDHSFWVDEGFSVHFAHTPWARFWKVSWSREGNMLLYYLLLRGWAHFAVTEFQLRLLSVIFGVAGVLMIYVLGRTLFSRATGLIAAALLAVHAFHVYYSQEARSYPLTIFLLILSAWLFTRFVRDPGPRVNRMGYPIAAALAFYAHIFALLVILSQWLAFFSWRKLEVAKTPERGDPKADSRSLISAIKLFFLLSFPMLIFAIFKNKGQLDWIPPLTPSVFFAGLTAITGKGGAWLLALYLALALVAAVCALRSADGDRRFGALLALSWALFPIAVFMLYSLHRPLFLDRYLVLLVPAFVLLAAEGVVRLAQLPSLLRVLSVPALALLLALSLRATWWQYDAIKWLDWKTATHFVTANMLPGDVLCFTAPGSP